MEIIGIEISANGHRQHRGKVIGRGSFKIELRARGEDRNPVYAGHGVSLREALDSALALIENEIHNEFVEDFKAGRKGLE